MTPMIQDQHPIHHAAFPDRSMPSSHVSPRPVARKRTSTQLNPFPQSPAKRFEAAKGLEGAGSTPHFKAEGWFNDTNKDATAMNHISFQDNDPPFYVGRPSSSGGNSDCAVPSIASNPFHLGPPTAPTRSLLAHLEASRSSSEDFRSVIDDLTIQNKKLKKKLKKYERLHCSHLQDEKLFEIRIHGLAAGRKRELEETLRSFVSSTEDDPLERRSPMVPSPLKHTTFPYIPAALRKYPSSSTLYSKHPIDSAYASMSGAQTGHSHSQPQDRTRIDQIKSDNLIQGSHARQENVKSYLHDMPQTLMPKHSMAMSDRSKSKMVVKRLERIFTGKGAASRHNQSHQQEEVSQSAAHADRTRMEARGRPSTWEGVREAHILPADADLQMDPMIDTSMAALQSRHSNVGRDSSRSTQVSHNASPEQRPTRPLDLDLHRAQVPADNIEYIRHLRLAPPTSADADSESDAEGWVYLNLLTSMAQLHTLNVTPEFIRHAVADFSHKIEISVDGTRARWQGGGGGTRMSSDSDESDDIARLKSMATTHSGLSNAGQESYSTLPPASSAAPEVGKRRPVTLGQSIPGGKFNYKPLFFHGSTDSDGSGQASASSSSDILESGTGWNSGINPGSHGLQEAEATLRRHNASIQRPIIFYHKARFCTDLSGDPSCRTIYEGAYHQYTQQAIGCPSPPQNFGHDFLDEDTRDGDLPTDAMEFDVDELDNVKSRSILDLDELKSCISDCAASTCLSSPAPVDMEVSGIGGIEPEDNFVVKVQVRHNKPNPQKSSIVSPFASPRRARRLLQGLSKGATNILPEQEIPRSQPTSSLEIVSTVKFDLAPSPLPPPSFICIPFSPSESESGDSDDQRLCVSVNSYRRIQADRPNSLPDSEFAIRAPDIFMDPSPEESSASSYASTSGSGSDDSSIDLLAHARVLDPDTIAAREREFDNNAVRNGNQPPSVTTGSSALATLGEICDIASQGSGFPLAANQAESDVDSMSVDGNEGSVWEMSQ